MSEKEEDLNPNPTIISSEDQEIPVKKPPNDKIISFHIAENGDEKDENSKQDHG